jgi:hypothetical protein
MAPSVGGGGANQIVILGIIGSGRTAEAWALDHHITDELTNRI